ncbi:SH3 domain-containing protein [Microbacterium esteraromaticum]|uniref:SH3 domain-containing protein n=1 Tax=Microbacterium esteraromaticum TaxID=57043 RepID=UPI002367FFCF|nr:SH3 domain-containing protein [Microbacterium esteraromaticum]WDH78240.1 SH3 domain-containing protein [Microbacterium esteraromaticum]
MSTLTSFFQRHRVGTLVTAGSVSACLIVTGIIGTALSAHPSPHTAERDASVSAETLVEYADIPTLEVPGDASRTPSLPTEGAPVADAPETKKPAAQPSPAPDAPATKKPAPVVEAVSATLYVTAPSLNIRSTPSTSGNHVGSLSHGAKVAVNGKQSGWYRLADGRGWVSGDHLSSKAPAAQPKPAPVEAVSATFYVTASSLNIRSAPSTSGNRVGSLSHGTKVAVNGKQSGWFRLADGRGWVSGDHLSSQKPKPAARPVSSNSREAAIAEGRRLGVQVVFDSGPDGTSGHFGKFWPHAPNVAYIHPKLIGDWRLISVVRHEAAHAEIYRICGTYAPLIAGNRAQNITDAFAMEFYGGLAWSHYPAGSGDHQAAKAIRAGNCG